MNQFLPSWKDRSVVWILIFLEKFEKISSADFIAKNLKTISSAEFIDADFIEKNFHCWFHWKKFLRLISLKKIFSNPKTDQTNWSFSNPKPRFSRTDRSFLSSFPTRVTIKPIKFWNKYFWKKQNTKEAYPYITFQSEVSSTNLD